MQGKKLLARLTGILFLGVASSAFAVMSVPYGWYIEGNIGSTHLSNASFPGSSSSSGVGGNANVGYKFMPYFATELGYTRYANTSIKNGAGTQVATDKFYSYDLAGKGILPVANSGFELFAKIGAQRLNSKISVSNSAGAVALGIGSSNHSVTGIYLGIGADYAVLPELALVAQWQRAQGNNSTGNMDLISAGINFIFG